jgi:hypothetical protein
MMVLLGKHHFANPAGLVGLIRRIAGGKKSVSTIPNASTIAISCVHAAG